MGAQTTPMNWGAWMLGDLPGVLTTAMDVLGPAAAVTSARVLPPHGTRALPEVQLEVAGVGEASRLRDEVEGCEFVSVFDECSTKRSWDCVVAGIRLRVFVSEVES